MKWLSCYAIALHLPITSAISVRAASASAHPIFCLRFSITKLAHPLVLHEHITSIYVC